MTPGSPGPFIDPEAPALPGPDALPDGCQVVVIGAGLAGTAVALFLAREGVEVCVLEARDRVGAGGSGRGLGHVENGVLEHPHRTVAALGRDRAATLFQWTDRGKQLLDDEGLLDRCGVLWASVDDREPADVTASVEALHELERRAEAWRPAQVDAHTGGSGFGPGLWLPDDGRIDPWRAVHTLSERARQAGVRFFGGCRAHLVDDTPAAGVVVEASGRRVEADVVVIAAGPGSGGVTGALQGRVTPFREQALRTAPLSHDLPGLNRAGHGWTTWTQRPDRSLVVSGARWASGHLEIGESDDTGIHPAIQEKLEGFMRRFLRVDDAPIVDRWAYTLAQTPDGLPIIGPLPGDPRRIVCTGFHASPAALAMAGARAVADGLLGDDTEEGRAGESPWMLSPRRMVRWRNS